MNKPVTVIGMHRSGTSVTAGILHKLGVNMGENMISGNKHNPDGYFEDKNVVDINRQILDDNGGNWLNPPQRIVMNSTDDIKQFVKHREEKYTKWGFKDPRTTLTYPVWQNVQDFNIVFVHRDNEDIINSLMRRKRRDRKVYKRCTDIYKDRMKKIRKMKEPENYLDVDYDELTTVPDRVVEHIARFVNEPVNEEAVELVKVNP